MSSLGSLYYELFLKDRTDQGLKEIEKKLKNLGVELDTKKLTESLKKSVESYKGKDVTLGVKTQYLHDAIRAALKQPEFPIKITVNKAEAQDAVREALRRAGLQQGFTGSDKRQYDAETKRLAAMTRAQAAAAASNALAQQRLARAHSITEGSVRKHTSATISLNSALKGNITLSRELGSAIGAAYSVVALKNFMTKVVEIGGELEQQKLAMKAILGDEGMANAISSQINTLAVKSPFGIMELNQYAKQLTAFQIPYNELYDTMKRMADVSAAVGVDMGRIILAYGQVRAAKFLKGTELRQFTEANIPLIDMLAERFTKLKGEIVSAGDIMDMISNKEVSFEDVKAVLWELTGEGGRFYNMQEVLSESVKAKWKNLADAIDLMFADIAESTSGPLKTTAELLTELTTRWKQLAVVVSMAVVAFGMYKAAMLVTNKMIAYNTTLTNLNGRAISANLTKWRLFQREVGKGWKGMVSGMKSFFSNISNLVGVATGTVSVALTALAVLWERNSEHMKQAEDTSNDLFVKATEGAKNLESLLASMQPAEKLDMTALAKGVEDMEEAIKNYSVTPIQDINNALATQDGLIRPIQERYEALRKKLVEIKAEFDKIADSNISGMIESAEKKTTGFLVDGVRENIADYDKAVADYQKKIARTAAERPKAVHKAIREVEAISESFREATKNMTSDAQKFSELANNRQKYGFSENATPTAAELLGDLSMKKVKEQRATMVKDLNTFWNELEIQASVKGIYKLADAEESDKRAYASQIKGWIDSHAVSDSTKKELMDYASSKLGFKFDTRDMVVVDDSVTTPDETDTGKDEFAEAVKERINLLKKAKSEYESLAKLVGRESAANQLADSPIFAGLKANEFLPEQAIPKTLDEYENALDKLQEQLTAKGLKTKKHRELNVEIEQVKFDINKKKTEEALKLALDKVSKEAERQLSDWNLFDKIRKATGNQDLAMSIAFGMNADAETDYPALVKKQFDEVAKAAKSGLTFDTVTPEALTKAPDEVQKAWEDATKKLQQYAKEQKDAVSDILSEYQSLQDKLTKIDSDRNRKIKTVQESDMSAPDKAKYIQRINVEADYQQFTQSADYLKFFSGIYSLTMQQAQEIGDKIRLNLDQRLQAGAISAEDYYKEIERINQQLTKLRNVKSDALTFLTGGVKGVQQKRLETADSDVLAQMTKVQEAQEALEKAKASGDIKQKAAAELTLKLAKQELDTRMKIRDAIVKDMESWQRVLDVVGVVSNIAGGLSDAFNSIKDMADAFGVDTESGAWGDIEAVMDTLTAVTGGVQKVVQSAMSGDIGGVLAGVVSTVTTPFTIWSKLHDKKLQKLIERSKEAAQIMQNQYDILEKRMANFLGNAAAMNTGVTGGAYGKQRQLMQSQLTELEKQRQAEIDKKKTDKSVVEDYNKQIEEMKISIRDFAQEAAKDIYSIDLSGWAEQLGNALVDAFAAGEDAAEAFDKTVGDIMRDVTSKMISQDILAPMFGDLRNFLFGENGMGGAFGSDFKLDSSELAAMKTYLDKIKNEGIPAAEELFNAINSATGGMLDDTDKAKGGLTAGIQAMTEDTGDLVASYLNGIRGDVSMQTHELWPRLLDVALPQISVIAQSQLDAQRQIAENTLRTAKATEAIVKSNDDISRLLTRVSQGGAKFHV